MPKWTRSGVLDNGLNDIKNNAVMMVLVSAYTAGDSAGTIQTNKVAQVAMVSGDFTLSSVGLTRRVTTAAKAGVIASASSSPADSHIAFLDVSNNPIWVTDETTDQAITSGNPVDFPAVSLTFNQPA